MRILVIGDIIGKSGRIAVQKVLPRLRAQYKINMVIANGENSAGGLGMTPTTANELFDSGIDVITSGNHIWHHREIIPYLNGDKPVLRPLNYPPGVPGRGYTVKDGITVVNLIGRTFIGNFDCPFRAMEQLLADTKHITAITIIDFHAEATSEKMALGQYLDGKVTAVLGTHTHVGTIDARVLSQGTAYVTDIGMVGPIDSVIGDDKESVLNRFLTLMPHRISVGKGRTSFNSVLITADEESGKALNIERIDMETDVS